MKTFWTTLLVLCSAIAASPLEAVEPASIDYHARTDWSKPLYNEFDGLYVNDRHDGIGGSHDYFVSQWSRAGIRLTVRDYWISGETIVPRTAYYRNSYYSHHARRWYSTYIPYTTYDRIPQWSFKDASPSVIHFRIKGEAYTYTEGEVSPELATALANAPKGNMLIRLEFQDEETGEIKSTYDVEIGSRTVEAWRTVFGEPLTEEEVKTWRERVNEPPAPPAFQNRNTDR